MQCLAVSSRTHGTAPRLSAEIFTIPLGAERYIVYAPLRQAAFVTNAVVVNFLADLKAGLFDEAVDLDGALVDFLRRLEILDARSETLPVTTFSGGPEPTAVTLFLTTACNLRCTYCYASAGETPTKHMSLDVAKRGIEFVAANAVKRQLPFIEVAYHGGGEPSVNWRVLTDSFQFAKQRATELGLEVRAGAASNGVLNNPQIDWIIANLNAVNLSFDGLPSAHDKHRLTVLGQASSHLVMHTMDNITDSGDSRIHCRIS
jgi:uncharacterized protein